MTRFPVSQLLTWQNTLPFFNSSSGAAVVTEKAHNRKPAATPAVIPDGGNTEACECF